MSRQHTAPVWRGTGSFTAYRLAIILGVLGTLVVVISWTLGSGMAGSGLLASPQASPTGTVQTLEDVIATLQRAGLSVETNDQTVTHEFFAVSATVLRVNGHDLQVFIYPSEAVRTADSDQISEGGIQIGTSTIFWVATPHFVATANVLTLFVSNDADLAQRIADAIALLPSSNDASPVASPIAAGPSVATTGA